ncbi:MAG: hypothetical protein Q8M12_00635, partial [bacterium]|nr:hypothetical protein [bacterium]
MENKKSKKITCLFLAIFVLFAGFVFLQDTKNICAQTADPLDSVFNSGGSDLTLTPGESVPIPKPSTNPTDLDNATSAIALDSKATAGEARTGGVRDGVLDSCANPVGFLGSPLACSLIVVLHVAGWVLNIAVILFAWIIDAEKLRAILVHPAIFKSWSLVRDFLNIGFILVLLFSAFSTIFQVDKYSYKKILLWLVIMALLVNFSYPITRFIIDVSNTLMYTLLS